MKDNNNKINGNGVENMNNNNNNNPNKTSRLKHTESK